MVVETNLEREFKFDVDPDFDPPDLRPLVGRTERLPEQRLITTYYDTGSLLLWGQGITLRHRVESPAEGAGRQDIGKWTLKLPALATGDEGDRDPGGAGDRWELTWKANGDRVPDEARAVISGLVRHEPLEQVLVLSATRRRLLLHGAGGDAWGEIDDDLVEVVSGGRQGLRFRQLELELIGLTGGPVEPGSRGPLPEAAVVVDALRRCGAQPGGGSKFALAAGLDRAGPAGAGPHATVGELIGSILRADADLWLEADYRLRVPDRHGDLGRPEVEVVRLAQHAVGLWRSHLSALAPGLDPVWRTHLERDLVPLAAALDRVRALDVVMRRVAIVDDQADATARQELQALLEADRHLAATELAEALSSASYQEMLGRMHAARRAAPFHGLDPDAPPEPFLREVLRTSWRRARRAVRAGEPGWEARVAKRAGRLASIGRVAELYLGRRAARLADTAAEVAGRLSEVADARTVSEGLRETAFHPSMAPAVAFLAGRIAGRADGEADRLAGRARREGDRLARRRRGAWLG